MEGPHCPRRVPLFIYLLLAAVVRDMTKLLDPEVVPKGKKRRQWAAAVGLVWDLSGNKAWLLYDVQGYEEDGSEAVRAVPGLLRATAALMVSPHLSPTPLQAGIPRRRAAESYQRFLLAPEPHL